jgi:hypothetical protein
MSDAQQLDCLLLTPECPVVFGVSAWDRSPFPATNRLRLLTMRIAAGSANAPLLQASRRCSFVELPVTLLDRFQGINVLDGSVYEVVPANVLLLERRLPTVLRRTVPVGEGLCVER